MKKDFGRVVLADLSLPLGGVLVTICGSRRLLPQSKISPQTITNSKNLVLNAPGWNFVEPQPAAKDQLLIAIEPIICSIGSVSRSFEASETLYVT
jgi:hypothetical protein